MPNHPNKAPGSDGLTLWNESDYYWVILWLIEEIGGGLEEGETGGTGVHIWKMIEQYKINMLRNELNAYLQCNQLLRKNEFTTV